MERGQIGSAVDLQPLPDTKSASPHDDYNNQQ